MKCRKRRENWQVDTCLKCRVLDTAVVVMDKTGDSTLMHCRNNPRVGTQRSDRSDVLVQSYQTIVISPIRVPIRLSYCCNTGICSC